MQNIFTYLNNNQTELTKENFNSVDALVFSLVAYFKFEKMNLTYPASFKEIVRTPYFALTSFQKELEINHYQLAILLASSYRYRKVYLVNFKENFSKEKENQFASITLVCDNAITFLAFRGTDATLTGWKEDFLLSCVMPIPSQKLAEDYARGEVNKYRCDIYLGGHSKGGNLAFYAASKVNNKYIKNVFSFDGPGFLPAFVHTTEYQNMLTKAKKYIPQDSIIGTLLYEEAEVELIQSFGPPLLQHNPYTWVIENNDFIRLEEQKKSSTFLKETLHTWIETLPLEKRKKVIEIIFSIIEKKQEQKISLKNFFSFISFSAKEMKGLSPEDRKMILQLFTSLFESSKLTIKNQRKRKTLSKK